MLGEEIFNQLRSRRHFQHFLRFFEQIFVAGRNRRFKADGFFNRSCKFSR